MGKYGKNLRVGDTICVWWSSKTKVPNQDRIVEIRHITAAEKTWPSYKRMMQVFPDGYAFATFLSGVEMTIDLGDWYETPAPTVRDLTDPAFSLPLKGK